MIRLPINGMLAAEDPTRFFDDEDIPQEIVAVDAAEQIRSGFYTLASCASGGNREALEDLLNLTREMIHFLEQGLDEVEPSDEGSKEHVLDLLRELAGKSTSWPVNLPVEPAEQKKAINSFNERPYGEHLDYNIRKPGRRGLGPDDYTVVTLRIVRCLRKMQRDIKNGKWTAPKKGRIPWKKGTVPASIFENLLRLRFGSRPLNLEELSEVYWDVAPVTLSKIQQLPELIPCNWTVWTDVASEFLGFPKTKMLFLSEAWSKMQVASGKTPNSFLKDRIKKGLEALDFVVGK